MENFTQNQIAQNINQSAHALHQILINLCLILGGFLFWVSALWFIINVIHFFLKKKKIGGRLKFKWPLILFIFSLLLTITSFLMR